MKSTNDFFKGIAVSKTLAPAWLDDEGIVCIGLYEFLLNTNSLDII